MSHVTENGSVEAECLALSEDVSSELEWSFSSFCERLRPLTLSLPDSDYNRMIQPLLDRSILPLTRLLNDLDLGEDDIQEIVMVGGTSRKWLLLLAWICASRRNEAFC
jgi:molecular chaperone DnaK (HSP70)